MINCLMFFLGTILIIGSAGKFFLMPAETRLVSQEFFYLIVGIAFIALLAIRFFKFVKNPVEYMKD